MSMQQDLTRANLKTNAAMALRDAKVTEFSVAVQTSSPAEAERRRQEAIAAHEAYLDHLHELITLQMKSMGIGPGEDA